MDEWIENYESNKFFPSFLSPLYIISFEIKFLCGWRWHWQKSYLSARMRTNEYGIKFDTDFFIIVQPVAY
jgi:hypothetical protein